jgi:hypothetical protein
MNSSCSICCRRKRKWDQPAESLVSAGVPVSDAVQLGNVGSLVAISLPGAASVSGALLTNPQIAIVPPMFLVPSMPQNTAAVVPKLNQVRYFIVILLTTLFMRVITNK